MGGQRLIWAWLLRTKEVLFWTVFCAGGVGWVALKHETSLWVVALVMAATAALVFWTVNSIKSTEPPQPKPWGFHPRAEDFGDEHKKSWDHIPLDDLVSRWSGRLPEKNSTCELTTKDQPAPAPALESAEGHFPFNPRRRVVIGNPPPCQLPSQFLRPVRYIRLTSWEICQIVGPTSYSDRLRIRRWDERVDELDIGLLVVATPKKGEWWHQESCGSCLQFSQEEILFLEDGNSIAVSRVFCGCLTPINYGRGNREYSDGT